MARRTPLITKELLQPIAEDSDFFIYADGVGDAPALVLGSRTFEWQVDQNHPDAYQWAARITGTRTGTVGTYLGTTAVRFYGGRLDPASCNPWLDTPAGLLRIDAREWLAALRAAAMVTVEDDAAWSDTPTRDRPKTGAVWMGGGWLGAAYARHSNRTAEVAHRVRGLLEAAPVAADDEGDNVHLHGLTDHDHGDGLVASFDARVLPLVRRYSERAHTVLAGRVYGGAALRVVVDTPEGRMELVLRVTDHAVPVAQHRRRPGKVAPTHPRPQWTMHGAGDEVALSTFVADSWPDLRRHLRRPVPTASAGGQIDLLAVSGATMLVASRGWGSDRQWVPTDVRWESGATPRALCAKARVAFLHNVWSPGPVALALTAPRGTWKEDGWLIITGADWAARVPVSYEAPLSEGIPYADRIRKTRSEYEARDP